MTQTMGRLYLPPQVLVVVALLAAVGALLTLLAGPASGSDVPRDEAALPAPAPDAPVQATPVAAEPRTAPAPAPSPRPGFAVLRPARGAEVVLRARPGGRVVARLGARTEFGSPTTLAVAKQRGSWLGVVTTHRPNGRVAWVDPAESPVRTLRTRISLVLDLSARRLVLRRGETVLRRMTVGVGRSSSPTPVGRFAVTDKLPGSRYGSYYGCCIVALSAHQPNLPPGWTGGDRIAVHGTDDPGSIGVASSAGCPRASDADLRHLMRRVPLGAPVFVRA